MKMEEKSLEEMPNNSPEYTEQQKKIADMRERRAEVKGKFNIALGIFQSKERFVDQIVILGSTDHHQEQLEAVDRPVEERY